MFLAKKNLNNKRNKFFKNNKFIYRKKIYFLLIFPVVIFYYFQSTKPIMQYPHLNKNDIVFVSSSTWRGVFVNLMQPGYTHVGIAGPNGSVIHASPHQYMDGNVSIADAQKFFKNVTGYKIIAGPKNLYDMALKEKGKPFDKKFNRMENQFIYCTELIELAFHHLGHDIFKKIKKKFSTHMK